jgi:predicted nucleotidyltransferase
MNDSLLDISRKIEPQKAAVLAAVDRAAGELKIPFFVVGGAARDFIMQDGYNIRSPRVTHDVDIGVGISLWEEYSRLIERLTSADKFKRTAVEHCYESPEQIKVDILPFGAIAGPEQKIQWPKDKRAVSMTGFNDAYKAALTVTISSSPYIRKNSLSRRSCFFKINLMERKSNRTGP